MCNNRWLQKHKKIKETTKFRKAEIIYTIFRYLISLMGRFLILIKRGKDNVRCFKYETDVTYREINLLITSCSDDYINRDGPCAKFNEFVIITQKAKGFSKMF